MKTLWVASLCAFLIQACRVSGAVEPEDSVVKVLVTFQEHHPFLPWQKTATAKREGYGVAIGSAQVVTTENLVRNHTLVEILKAGSGEKIPVSVVESDDQANAALLKLPDSVNTAFAPLSLAERLPTTGLVEILQFDDTARLQRGRAQVFQVAMEQLPSAPYAALTYSLLTDLNVNGEGAAVLLGGRLAGLVVKYDRGTRTASVLPCSVLRTFIDDSRSPPYEGFASAGFVWAPLVDPAKRAWLQVSRAERGILVLAVLPDSGAAESLRPGDAILEWDGHAIDNLGFYNDPDFGRLSLPYLISGRRKPGDVAEATLIREGLEMKAQVRLSHASDADALIPENVTGQPEEYLVEGGLMIRELTGRYLRAHGPKWQGAADPRLVHTYLTRRQMPEKAGDRVVFLAGVLPDSINMDYDDQHLREGVITRVNGETIRNMRDVFRIAERDGHIGAITLQAMGVDLVLDAGGLGAANSRLARLYRIPRLRYQRPEAARKTTLAHPE